MTKPRTMRNVVSLWRISQQLKDWLVQHAGEYDGSFIDAFSRDIAYVCDAAYLSLLQVDEAEVAVFADELDTAERIDFDLHVRYVADRAEERFLDVSESYSFRVGNALMTAPRIARDALGRLQS